MSICTFSLYELYWCFKNWQRLGQRSGEEISPFWRALFAPIWNFSLFGRVRAHAEADGVGATWSAGLLGALYLVLSVAWRLPDPWWLVSFASFVPFLPVIKTQSRVNSSTESSEDRNTRFSVPNVAGIFVGGVFMLLAVWGTLLPEQAVDLPPAEWQAVESADGRFTVSFPGRPAETSATQPNPTGRPPIGVHSLQLEKPHGYYALQWMRFGDEHIDPSATVERVLESTRDGMLTNTAGELLDGGFLEHGGWPALDATIRVTETGDTVLGRTRVLLAGRTLYTLMAFGTAADVAQQFLDSFQVLGASDDFRLPRRASLR